MGDRPLSNAFILDTEEDIGTKILTTCSGCGNELEVVGIEEHPEVAVVLSVSACDACKADTYREGYSRGSNDNTRGF